MTLVVSVRVPDGVVIGSDSLATLAMQPTATASGPVQCPKCGEEHQVSLQVPLPRGAGTLSTLPSALKLMPLWGRFGVATYGNSMIADHSMFALVQEFQKEHDFGDLKEAAKGLGEWLQRRFAETTDIDSLPDGSFAFGFHVSGYKDGHPLTATTRVGKQVTTRFLDGFGATIDGETSVVTHMWGLKEEQPQLGATYQAWSVSDAADYVEFLISLTANSQRFGLMVPTVGGSIDIAVVMPQNSFRWMKQKELAKLLLEEVSHGYDTGEPGATADVSGPSAS